MIVKVFGRLAELCGSHLIEIDPADSVDSVKDKIERKFPELKNQKYLVAIDKQIAGSNVSLKHDSEIALMPPYSGG